MIRAVALIALLALAACGQEPRSAGWFEAHAQEATRVVGACRAAVKPGPECAIAEAGLAAARRDARMDAAERAFAR
jgi:hypothetical protein